MKFEKIEGHRKMPSEQLFFLFPRAQILLNVKKASAESKSPVTLWNGTVPCIGR